MPLADVQLVFQWWGTLFLVGAAVYPITKYLFGEWSDRGFLFTKAVGMALVTFLVYLLGITHIAPFTQMTVWAVLGILFLVGIPLYTRKKETHTWRRAALLGAEELFFFAAMLFWTWVKAHEPSLHNLEKFMDFGFTKSILDSRFFPAPDMWYAGYPINYYYFGHTVMAVLTRLSGIDLTYTFNLMLATIFSLSLTMSFAIGRELTKKIAGGVLTAFLVTLAGNMQTIYAFTQGYTGDAVKPFWQLFWPIRDFWKDLPIGLNTYWYANATRFIPYTIHEFPSYSFVVSDVHGHVLSIPFVLLAIALLFKFWADKKIHFGSLVFYGFLSGVLLMTNALDGPIYFGLLTVVLIVSKWDRKDKWVIWGKEIGVTLAAAAITSLPFLLHFKSFVSGVAVNCPPALLADTKMGPLLFEGVEKCQHSPLWMMWLLWGFFIFCGAWLLSNIFRSHNKKVQPYEYLFVIFFVVSVALIIFPEFFYFKDIYPMHFRSNTMFKLGYQAFIMFSIVSAYTIVKFFRKKLFLILLLPQLFLVSVYPVFSVRSYFNSLRRYEGIYGLGWLRTQYPENWAAISWLNQQVKPAVIVEADGDSYTDASEISAFTGIPTIIGWPVHEWLWRGSYDVVSPRREEVRRIYESKDVEETRALLTKYHVTYVVVGTLERIRFTNLNEEKFLELGKSVFASGATVIYQVL